MTCRMGAVLVKPNSEALRNPHVENKLDSGLENFLCLPVYSYCKSSRWQQAAHRRVSEKARNLAIVIQLAFAPVESSNGGRSKLVDTIDEDATAR